MWETYEEQGDKKLQRAILAFLLAEFPARHTRESLWLMGLGPLEPMEEAIHMLDVVGLVWRDGQAIVPTAAARHFEWLELS
jgi:hypothetical protein